MHVCTPWTRWLLMEWQANVMAAIGILCIALYSQFPDIGPPKSPETRPVLRFSVAVRRCSNAGTDEMRPTCIANNMAVSCHSGTSLVHTLDQCVWMLKLNSQHWLRSPLLNPLSKVECVLCNLIPTMETRMASVTSQTLPPTLAAIRIHSCGCSGWGAEQMKWSATARSS